MDMDINPNKRLLTRNAQDQVSAFGTDTTERAQDLGVTRQYSAMGRHNLARNRVYLWCFGLMEGTGVDSVVNDFWSKLAYSERCARQGEELMRTGQSDGIKGTDRDDTSNEQLER
jgi:hypothetical protein